MTKDLIPIDVSNAPELLRLAEEVLSSGEGHVLRRNHEDLVVVRPASPTAKRRGRRGKSAADLEAFRSAAGSWNDVDTDKLVAAIYESRGSSRPPVDL